MPNLWLLWLKNSLKHWIIEIHLILPDLLKSFTTVTILLLSLILNLLVFKWKQENLLPLGWILLDWGTSKCCFECTVLTNTFWATVAWRYKCFFWVLMRGKTWLYSSCLHTHTRSNIHFWTVNCPAHKRPKGKKRFSSHWSSMSLK